MSVRQHSDWNSFFCIAGQQMGAKAYNQQCTKFFTLHAGTSNHVSSGDYNQWNTSWDELDYKLASALGLSQFAADFGFRPEPPAQYNVESAYHGCPVDTPAYHNIFNYVEHNICS